MRKYIDPVTDTNQIVGVKSIPKHWGVIKLKYIAKIFNGQDQKEVLDENGIYPIYGSGGIFGYANKYLFEGPSVLLGRKGTVNKPRLVENPFWSVDTAYYTKISKKVNVYFFYHLCNQINFDYYIYGSAVPSMTASDLNNIKFPLPPLQEQQSIVNFLDYKTNQIDQFIANRQKQIELLKEQKAGIINKAVTKGINSNAKMMDSAIEWIGDIPEHWGVWKLKFLVKNKLKYGANEAAELDDRTLPRYIRITDFGYDGKLKDDTFKSLPFEIAKDYFLKEGDVLFARSGATVGKTMMFENYLGTNNACFAGYLIMARCNKDKMLPKFLYYYTKTPTYDNWKEMIFIENTIQNIGADKYNLLLVPTPSIDEQQLILNFINEETSKIENIVSKYQKQIDLMQEYRTALISQAVTGKIDVRNWKLKSN